MVPVRDAKDPLVVVVEYGAGFGRSLGKDFSQGLRKPPLRLYTFGRAFGGACREGCHGPPRSLFESALIVYEAFERIE